MFLTHKVIFVAVFSHYGLGCPTVLPNRHFNAVLSRRTAQIVFFFLLLTDTFSGSSQGVLFEELLLRVIAAWILSNIIVDELVVRIV